MSKRNTSLNKKTNRLRLLSLFIIKYCVPRTPQNSILNIINPQKLIELCGDWKTYLHNHRPALDSTLEQHLNTGRPLGDELFMNKIEILLGRELKKKKPGPKKKEP